MMGISSASTSTYRLSMPSPAQADIRCSTVDTRVPSFCSTEARRVSPIALAVAGISTAGSRSTRVKMMPLPGAAGRNVNVTLRPECNPMPTVLTTDLMVRCFNMAALNSLSNSIVFIYALYIGDNPKHTIFTCLPPKRLLYRDVRPCHSLLTISARSHHAVASSAARRCGMPDRTRPFGGMRVASEARQHRFRIADGELPRGLHL